MDDKLYVLWTNGDPVTSEKMVLMYAHNSILQTWWREVIIIIWGGPAKLVSESLSIQQKIKEMQEDGVVFTACKACADQLGVSSILEGIGIEVKFWGDPLTELIKGNAKILYV